MSHHPAPPELGPLDALVERIANAIAARLVERLNGHATPKPSLPDRWLTPQQAAALLQVPVAYTYRHQRELGGVHVSPRVLRFPESALRRRLARHG